MIETIKRKKAGENIGQLSGKMVISGSRNVDDDTPQADKSNREVLMKVDRKDMPPFTFITKSRVRHRLSSLYDNIPFMLSS